jgi:hypothetical protein
MGIQLNGLEGIVDRLESYEDVQKFETQLKKACALVERAAKEKAPKDTGALKQSITSEIRQDGDNLVGVVLLHWSMRHMWNLERDFLLKKADVRMCLGVTKTIEANGTLQVDSARNHSCALLLTRIEKRFSEY